MRNKIAQHGTPAKYGEGCRCKKCTMAKSAKEWAYRNVKKWVTPIRVYLSDSQHFAGDLTISSHMIVKAIERREYTIKKEVLEELWKMQQHLTQNERGEYEIK